MELAQYIRLIRRWLWLILLAAFVGAGVTFIVRVNQAPIYVAEATVIVGSALESPNPNSIEIRTGIDLAVTYAQIVRTYDILDAVVQALDLEIAPENLNNAISTSIVSGTSLLEISVRNTDRILAAEIANEIVTQLILQSPSNLTIDQQANIDILQTEIDAQSEELTSLRTELGGIIQRIETETLSAEEETRLTVLRSSLTNQINGASANIAQNLNTIASLSQRTNSVEIIETARIPTNATSSRLNSAVILSAMASAGLAFGAVLVYEYLNDTIRSADELSRLINLPVLGVVARFGKKDMGYPDRLLVNLESFSKTSEEYRTLRTNILYSTSKEKQILIITSASPEEGKTVTTANLAVSMALSGLRVLLIDADLRRPKIHECFSLEHHTGLSNLLTGQISLEHKINSMDEDTTPIRTTDGNEKSRVVMNRDVWTFVAQKTLIPNLSVIPSGFIPTNPSELLGSTLMKRWMKEFISSPHVDIILIDTPPALAVSDSAILAASLQAKVILVVQANRTRRGIITNAKERIVNVNADVLGAVLNNVDLRDENYYGYNYTYYYTPQTGESNKRTKQST